MTLRATKLGLPLTLVFALSCGGSLYKVKPPSALPPIPDSAAHADAGSLSIRAQPLLTDEESQEIFESNLQLAGLLPVRVEILHHGGDTVDFRKVRFHLRDAGGAEWKLISTKQAIKHILKANGMTVYNPDSRKTFEREFRAYELDLRTPLTNEQKRQGMLVFMAPKKQPVASPHGLVLAIDGLPQPVTLNLN
jgi:hypothetical protein